MLKSLRQWVDSEQSAIIPGLIVVVLILVARLFGAFEGLELITLDWLLRSRPREQPDPRILIVGIDAKDIERLQQYPISDAQLATTLSQLLQYEPRVIGLDIFRDSPIAPGTEQFQHLIAAHPNIIVIEKAFPGLGSTPIAPPSIAKPAQVGFADAVLDQDGVLRRSLLGATTDANDKLQYRFSLTIQLAIQYLKSEGILLGNGLRDPYAIRFGNTELPRLQQNSGGYRQENMNGEQLLINFRNSPTPFELISLRDLESGAVEKKQVKDRIVLIGITDAIQKDILRVPGILQSQTQIPGQAYGVEIQAHAVSQIVSAVKDQRPLLNTWLSFWDYAWVLLWGLMGLGLSLWIQRLLPYTLILLGLSFALGGLSYAAILIGLWTPLVPALLGFLSNGVGVAAFSRYDKLLRARIRDRQQVINQTFDAIHNGPLQNLGQTLRAIHSQTTSLTQVGQNLQDLNQDLRKLHQLVSQEVQGQTLFINPELTFNPDIPLHEMLYAVYNETLKRDFIGFDSIIMKLITFDPLDTSRLTNIHQRDLCRVLEELLCNVGKHGRAVTQLTVTCHQCERQNVIQVIDNGNPTAENITHAGQGTILAQQLATQLQGEFCRSYAPDTGMTSEIRWPVKPQIRWMFWQ